MRKNRAPRPSLVPSPIAIDPFPTSFPTQSGGKKMVRRRDPPLSSSPSSSSTDDKRPPKSNERGAALLFPPSLPPLTTSPSVNVFFLASSPLLPPRLPSLFSFPYFLPCLGVGSFFSVPRKYRGNCSSSIDIPDNPPGRVFSSFLPIYVFQTASFFLSISQVLDSEFVHLSECSSQADCDSVNERFQSKCGPYGCRRGIEDDDGPVFQCDKKALK